MRTTTYIAPSLVGKPPSLLRSRAWAFLLTAAAILTLLLSTASSSFADSATWLASPATGDWNAATNWTAGGPPNGPSDTATFDVSTITGVSLAADTEVNGIVFDAGASAFTITASPGFSLTTLTISGTGITNNSGITQNFVGNSGTISFTFSATAGSLTVFTNNPGVEGFSGGSTTFSGTATAGSATINNNAATTSGFFGNGSTVFSGGSAGNATINNDGATTSGARGGYTVFFSRSDAGSATLIANGGLGGGEGGFIQFAHATGGTARVEVFGNGTLDISVNRGGLTTGSIEGDGLVFLGSFKLTVGTNNLSTTFSGTIQDGGSGGGSGASLRKIGTGTLALSGESSYTGGTAVSAGALLVSNTTGSATGTGSVAVNAGTLGGSGIIAGAVTVGTGGAGATFQPSFGTTRKVTLTIQSLLTFKADATYIFRLKSRTAEAIANGVTIESGAQFNLLAPNRQLPIGRTATVISNTAGTPISGTFANLPDGGTITVGTNTFQANYEGGDGNDLTLTVVP